MLIEAGRSILVIIDVQKKLMPAIHSNNDLMEQILILQKSAKPGFYAFYPQIFIW